MNNDQGSQQPSKDTRHLIVVAGRPTGVQIREVCPLGVVDCGRLRGLFGRSRIVTKVDSDQIGRKDSDGASATSTTPIALTSVLRVAPGGSALWGLST